MRDLRKDALELAALGWQVFPLHSPRGDECDCNKVDCESPAKHPRIKGGLTNATTDPGQIERWWSMWPHANIGLATGKVSGVVVMDVDPRHEGDVAFEALIAEHGPLPKGPAGFTGGGGWHSYYKHPGHHVPSRNGIIAPGIDVKADGGYVVAPPSVHITGVSYEWSQNDLHVPLPAMPAWLLEKAIAKQDRRFEAIGEPNAPIPQGQRNAFLASQAGAMRARNMSQSAIFAALLVENAERCDPPLDQPEIAKIAASIARYEGSVAIPVLAQRASPGTKRAAYVPEPFTAADLEHEDIPPIRWAVDGFMPEGLAIFGGKAKIGKSWKALNVSISVAEGDVVLDVFPTPEADVLMLALEDNKRRLQGRLRKLRPDGRWPARLHLETQWPRVDEGGIDALDAWLGQHPQARLVWIDTLAKFRARPTGKRNDIYAEDYDFGQAVQQLALKHGVCIVLITHLNKTLHEDYMDSIQGSAGITGSADTTIYLGRPRGVKGQGAARLRLTGRDIEEQDWAVTFDGMTCQWAIQGEFEDTAVGHETRELLEVMAKIGNPVTPEDIAAALKKTRPSAYKLLYRAALDGLIISHKGKLFTLLDSARDSLVPNVRVSFPSPPSTPSSPTADTTDTHDIPDSKDNADIDRQNGFNLAENTPETVDSWLARRQIARSPDQPCGTCGETNWIPRATGGFVCDTCKPWITKVGTADAP